MTRKNKLLRPGLGATLLFFAATGCVAADLAMNPDGVGLLYAAAVFAALGIATSFVLIFNLTRPVVPLWRQGRRFQSGYRLFVAICVLYPVNHFTDFTTRVLHDARERRAGAFTVQGETSIQQRDYNRAIADLSEAIRLDPTLAMAYSDRGLAQFEVGKYDESIADCTEAVRLEPQLINAYINRSRAWVVKSEFDKAIADCDKALRIDPNHAKAYTNRSLAWFGKSKYDRVIADCDQALRLDPRSALAFSNRGLAWWRKGRYKQALSDFAKALELDSTLAAALNFKAWIQATCPLARFRDGAAAVKNATTACELTGWDKFDMIATLASADAEAGDFANAVKWAQRAIELSPPSVVPKIRVALARFEKRKPYREMNQLAMYAMLLLP